MCSGFESIEKCLIVNTYNQAELLNNIFLGFDRKESLTTPTNLVTEELARPSFGRYYTIKPSFKITTNYREDQMYLSLSRDLNYVIHVFDPRYYLGFYNPYLPIVKKIVQPDDTAGWFHSLIITEVCPKFLLSWELKVIHNDIIVVRVWPEFAFPHYEHIMLVLFFDLPLSFSLDFQLPACK